jgi:hypothetical protein
VKSAHEPIPSLVPLDQETLDNYAAFDGPVVVCDASAILFRDKLVQFWPEAKWYLVKRPEADVKKSLNRLFPNNGDSMPILKQLMGGFVSSMGAIPSIDYGDLNDLCAIGKLWEYAVPGLPLDAGRLHRLCSMKIEAMAYSDPVEVATDCGGNPKIRRIA